MHILQALKDPLLFLVITVVATRGIFFSGGAIRYAHPDRAC